MSKFWLPHGLFEDMKLLAKASFPLETGGVLMGYIADNGEVVVEKLIGPGPTAKHGSHHFEPDAIYQQALLEQYFVESQGRTTYLGDWHTHPHGTAILSSTDKQTLARIGTTPSSQNKHPVMAVLAGDGKDWKLGVMQYFGMYRVWKFHLYSLLSLKIKLI